MRIIGGRFRGKVLEWASDGVTRPTTDRVKENIFNVLAAQFGAGSDTAENGDAPRVLDLFAGSGQIGLECISRWGARVVFNDTDARSREIIVRNLRALGEKFGGSSETVGAGRSANLLLSFDYTACLEKLRGEKFDLIYVDAPFADRAAPVRVAEFVRENDMLAPDGVVMVECEAGDMEFAGFEVRAKKYGRAHIYFLRLTKV